MIILFVRVNFTFSSPTVQTHAQVSDTAFIFLKAAIILAQVFLHHPLLSKHRRVFLFPKKQFSLVSMTCAEAWKPVFFHRAVYIVLYIKLLIKCRISEISFLKSSVFTLSFKVSKTMALNHSLYPTGSCSIL